MAEGFSSEQEKQQRFENIHQVYTATLGIEFPATPADSPNEITLPPASYGDFFVALHDQKRVDLDSTSTHIPLERSQTVGLLKSDGSLTNERVIVGGDVTTGFGDSFATIGRWLNRKAFKDPQPLTWWHIHPPEQIKTDQYGETERFYGQFLSNGDVAQRIGRVKNPLIYLLGAREGIRAIFQTKAAQNRGIINPNQTFNAMDEIAKFYSSRHQPPNEADLSSYLEERGLVLYGWKKERPEETVWLAENNGKFANGIHLNRIGQPLWLRRALELEKK